MYTLPLDFTTAVRAAPSAFSTLPDGEALGDPLGLPDGDPLGTSDGDALGVLEGQSPPH